MKKLEISTMVAIISVVAFFWLMIFHGSYVTKINKERLVIKGQISDLEVGLKEKEDTIEGLNNQVKVVRGKLAQTNQKLKDAEIEITSLEMDKQNMRLEISNLKRNRTILEARAKSLSEEKKMLEARLGSLTELKKAMRVAKENRRQQKILAQKEDDRKKLAMGNRGYIVKDRQFTMLKKLTIDVIPADVPKDLEK